MATAERVDVKFGAETSGFVAGVTLVKEQIEQLRAPVDQFISSLSGISEAVGAAFAFEKIAKWIEAAGEAAENAVNMATAIGGTAEQFLNFSESMQVALGSADRAPQIFRQLDNAIRTAYSHDMSRHADSFRNLGISVEDLYKHIDDPYYKLTKIAEAYQKFGDAGKSNFEEIFQRNWAAVAKAFREGTDAVSGANKAIKELGAPTQDVIERVEKLQETVNKLGVSFKNLGFAVADQLSGPLGKLLTWIAEAVAKLTSLKGSIDLTSIGIRIHKEEEERAPPRSVAENKEAIAEWLAAHGYPANQAAAVMGNIGWETGQTFSPATVGIGGAFGLFGFMDDLQKQLGGSTDIATQMALMDRNLALLDPTFRTATGSVKDFTDRFEKVFERASKPALAGREAEAAKVAADTTLPKAAPAAGETGSVTSTPLRISVTPGAQPGTADSEKEKADLEEALKALEQKRKARDANYAHDIEVAHGDLAQQTAIAQERAKADEQYFAQRNALIARASPVVRKSFDDEAAAAIEAGTKALAAENRLTDQSIALQMRALQTALALDKQREASQLRTAEAQAKIHQETASQLEADELKIVKAHASYQDTILAAERKTAGTRVTLAAEVEARIATAHEQTSAKVTEIENKAAEEVGRRWQQIGHQLGDQMGDALADVLERTKTFGEAMRSILNSLFKDFLRSLMSNIIGGGNQGLAGALGFGGGGGLFGGGGGGGEGGGGGGGFSLLGSILSPIATIGGAISGIGKIGSFLGDFGATGGFLDQATGAFASASTAASGAGSLLSAIPTFITTLASFLLLEKGGIVSARGGWVVPSFASGGILSMLHKNEMVLPANVSQWVQNAAAGGGGVGGGGHTFNFNVQAWDSRDVMRAAPQLVAALNHGMRHGARLNIPS